MHKKWTDRVELTKKTSHCKSRDFLRKTPTKNTLAKNRGNSFLQLVNAHLL